MTRTITKNSLLKLADYYSAYYDEEAEMQIDYQAHYEIAEEILRKYEVIDYVHDSDKIALLNRAEMPSGYDYCDYPEKALADWLYFADGSDYLKIFED